MGNENKYKVFYKDTNGDTDSVVLDARTKPDAIDQAKNWALENNMAIEVFDALLMKSN